MYGDTALGLVREARRAGPHALSLYNEDAVAKVIREVREVVDSARSETASRPYLYILHATILRNRRCLLAYLKHRTDVLRHVCWHAGATAPEEIANTMSLAERDFYDRYNRCASAPAKMRWRGKKRGGRGCPTPRACRRAHGPAHARSPRAPAPIRAVPSLLTRYRQSFPSLDLGASEVPPKEPFIEVRVLVDCGEIITENGPINLAQHSQHYVRRTDVERLIEQGLLQHIVH